ncbi:MAG TPA: alkaline shock response membrane anchor protein AmaP, partial [Actinomycetes bacterium]|nr:alkaline shock response membrane anchor protein AmaP [Actinomycetes bacterium]
MRAFNRVLSLLLGLALLAGGLLVAAEVAAALLDRGQLVIPARRWADALRATTFADARVVFAVVAAVGLVLFVAEARRWPKRRIPLADDQQRSWWLL